MPEHSDYARTSLDVDAGRIPTAPPVPLPETPFCIALIGDFSAGRAGARGVPLAARGGNLVDRDDVDAVLARMAPEVELQPGAPETLLRVTSLDDFHPDRLYERLPRLAALRETRRRLADPRTFAETAAAVRAPERDTPRGAVDATAGALATGSLLDMIVDAAPETTSAPAADDLQAFIRQALRPHLVPDPDPRQAQMLRSVDDAIAAELRAVLREPRVRELEALWRGVDLLVRRADTGSRLRVVLVDVSRDELEADLLGAHDVADSAMAALLRAAAGALPDPAPWAVLAGLHTFHPAHDAPLLERLARLGAMLGAPWIAAASDDLAAPPRDAHDDDDDDDDIDVDDAATDAPAAAADVVHAMAAPAWSALRARPHAEWLALMLPGFVLRQPYGDDEPCDVVRLEELEPGLDANAASERLLHANAALAGALMLARAFEADGWAMRPALHREVDRLPIVLHRDGGAVRALPCARHAAGERDALRLLEGGLMPLVTARESDSVRLLRWQSVASPATALRGRWADARR